MKLFWRRFTCSLSLDALAGSRFRRLLTVAFQSDAYNLAVVIASTFNLALVIVEIDSFAAGIAIPPWAIAGTRSLLVIFGLELALRAYTFREKNLKDGMFMLEALAVGAEICAVVFRDANNTNGLGVSILRILRLSRLSRSGPVVMYFPEMRMIIGSLVGAAVPLFWGAILLAFILIILAVFAVQLIHPLNQEITKLGLHNDCERCPRAFASVWQSVITLFQGSIAGDSWGLLTLPIIEHYAWTSMYFGLAYFLVAVAVMNVMLASVVDSATQARLENERYVAESKIKHQQNLMKRMIKICEDMDEEHKGYLTLEEVKKSYGDNREFRFCLRTLEVHEDELETVFQVMDEDQSGTVDYNEFAKQIFKMKTSDSHMTLLFLKQHVSKISYQVNESLSILKEDILQGLRRALSMEEEGLKLAQCAFEREEQAVSMVGTIIRELQEHNKNVENLDPVEANAALQIGSGFSNTSAGCLKSHEIPSTNQVAMPGSENSGPTGQIVEEIQQMTQSIKRLEDEFVFFAKHWKQGDRCLEPKMQHSGMEPKTPLPKSRLTRI